MKSNKGFTLIELLAVIVILAIIALIATPTILGVIETARQGSAESSALGYIDAVEKQIAIDMLDTTATNTVLKQANTSTGVIEVSALKEIVSVKGQTPTSGTLTYSSTTGTITDACLVITLNSKAYNVKYTGSTGVATVQDTACTTE
jgi:type IV pilus assembly protein PilA